ncbi:hypothetical protein OG856_46340 [Streptomyces sp. NBC_01594]
MASTVTRELLGDDEAFEAMTEFGREFRSEPRAVYEIHVNLELANSDFEEFSEAAHSDPERLYCSSWGPAA